VHSKFGTGFLPLETGAPKKTPEDDISAQRPEIGDHHAREMAAKAAFLLACVNIRVSEDCVVGAHPAGHAFVRSPLLDREVEQIDHVPPVSTFEPAEISGRI